MEMLHNQLSTEPLVGSEPDPLVSVIIGNYNYGQFLRQSIESVLNQSYRNFELIVVDDGSTDDSREIIKSYGDRLIPIFQENAGQIAAHTAGLQHSKGEIICLLDSDDCFYPDKLLKIVQSFIKHPEWLQISHTWVSVNTEGNPIGKSTSDILSQGNVKKLLLSWGKYACGVTSALTFRRGVLLKALPLYRNMPGYSISKSAAFLGVDSFLTRTVPFFGEVGCINEPLMFYRIHHRNVRARSDNIPKLMQEHINIADTINLAAAYSGLTEKFDVRRDPDYRAFEAIDRRALPWIERLQIICLSIQESISIGRSPRDTLTRLVYRSICVCFPQQGRQILRLGFRSYLLQLLRESK
ncbi:MAG: glycosyltransferase [Kovacikia sp.]